MEMYAFVMDDRWPTASIGYRTISYSAGKHRWTRILAPTSLLNARTLGLCYSHLMCRAMFYPLFLVSLHRSVAVHFSESHDQQLAIRTLKAYYNHSIVHECYAFQNSERYPIQSEIAGWPVYNVERELERQGLLYKEKDANWRLVENNFKKSPTYPAKLLIPRSINKNKFYKADVFYKNRMIAFSWKDPGGAGMLFRYTANVNTHICGNNHADLVMSNKHTDLELKEPIIKHILKLYPKDTVRYLHQFYYDS